MGGNDNYVLGSSTFSEQIAAALGRRVVAGKAGRPKSKPTKVL
jgi:putative transposase